MIVIGDDGSFTGAQVKSQEYNISHASAYRQPWSTDMYGSDYTIDYETALHSVVEAVDKIKDTARSHGRIFFVEVMGQAGLLALTSGIIIVAEGEETEGVMNIA